jgi:hypothetical protein
MRAMRKLVASTILLILSFGLALVGIWPASVSVDVGPQKVQVVNTPLPVSVQGTTSITGNVNVATLPAITLAAGTAVKINNPPEQPVLVREVSNGAEVARLGVSWVIPSGQNGIEQSVFTVPAGKNLVIELGWRCQREKPPVHHSDSPERRWREET